MAINQVCNHCGMPVRPGFKFCNVCGSPVKAEPVQQDSVEPYSDLMGYKGHALRLLTGSRTGEFVGIYPNCVIGRVNGDVKIDDATLSPRHAQLVVTKDEVTLEDLDSLNGVFLRLKDKQVLCDHDIILAGEHYFLYECFSPDNVEGDFGASFYASPTRGEKFRLIEILSGGRRGRACTAPDGGIAVGRTEGDFRFPDDTHMNAKHFTIRWTQRGGILVDYSENGTFIQIRKPTKVTTGDLFFAGHTLFTVV